MNRPLLSVLLALALTVPAFAGGTITWPLPPVPPGGNSAAMAAPKIDWVQRFQQNIDNSKKLPSIDLIFDGDSITDFWMGAGKPIWLERYAKLNAFDFGIAGDRTEHVLWRLQNGQVDSLHPKLIALMIGTNNLSANTPEQIAAGVTAVVQQYRQLCPDAVILLQGIFPRSASPTDGARAKIKAINQIISKLDDGKNVIYIDFGDKFLQPDGTLSKDIMPDFLHPSAKGYQIWADAIQPILDKYFPPAAPAPAAPTTPAPTTPAN